MREIIIRGRPYKLRLTLGVMEDLEDRGWRVLDLYSGDMLSIKLALDILELGAGVPREILRDIDWEESEQFANVVTAEIISASPKADGPAGGGEGDPDPGE